MKEQGTRYLTKTQWVYEELKRRIVEGELRPGDRIVTTHLARELGVSHIPVREAINRLRSEELVWSTPHSNTVVSSLSKKDLMDIYEIRIALESLAVRLAAQNGGQELPQKLDKLLGQMEKAVARGERDRYSQFNQEFHMIIYASCGNPRLVTLITDFRHNMERFGPFFLAAIRDPQQSLEEHKTLVQALKAGDPTRAEQLMVAHKRRSAQALFEELWHGRGVSPGEEGLK